MYAYPAGYCEVNARLAYQYDEVSGEDFYLALFPNNENTGDNNTDYSRPNAIYLYQAGEDGNDVMRRRIMLADTWSEDYLQYIDNNARALCSGIVYRGRANKLANAQRLNALIFDVDCVGDTELRILLARCHQGPDIIRSLPCPTYIAASGTGVHLYYQLDTPIDLYPSIKKQLKALKDDLTYKMWDPTSITKAKKIQYQSINQAFRMVGSLNEKYGITIRAYRTGEPISLNTLNAYVMDPANRLDLASKKVKGSTPLEVAKKKWPGWYQERIINGTPKAQTRWDISGKVHGKDPYALYHWWLRQINQVVGGHRYYYMMCLVSYARKCDVPKNMLVEDLKAAYEYLRHVEHTAPLTEHDWRSALRTWSKDLYNLPIDTISQLSGVTIVKNKRNGRKQKLHLTMARAIRDVMQADAGTNWRDGNGRPKGSGTKQQIIIDWRRENPAGKKIDCERATGLSRHTILKWWDASD